MTRRHRQDTHGSWHHVVNRAIARRSLFETADDIRYFLAGIAKAVRRGDLEVHAWCVLTTHFHMLVRSPKGELSNAMRRIQNAYARNFNRSRRRDGPLHRGRFTSKPVKSLVYRKVLVRYIDDNPVAAGLCTDPCEYPWGSAQQYAKPRGPSWLQREWVENWVAEQAGTRIYDPSDYPRSVDGGSRQIITDFVETRMAARDGTDRQDSLLDMAGDDVLEWLRRKAALADGTTIETPPVAATRLTTCLRAIAARDGAWRIREHRAATNGWHALHAGLLRDLAATNFAVIAQILGVSREHARRLHERHQRLMIADDDYAQKSAAVTHAILQDSVGSITRIIGAG